MRRPSASSRCRQSATSRARAASESPSIASRSTRTSTFVATLFTFWPPGPDARTARTYSARSGTRTVLLTTIARLMPRLYRAPAHHRSAAGRTAILGFVVIAERRRLTDVARGAVPADLYVRGATLLNVYTGELYPANVAAKGARIAYVGLRDEMVGPRTRVVDAAGRVLVPGYIDPHVHPSTLTTPSSLARFVLPLGTTAVVADTLQFCDLGGLDAFQTVADSLMTAPLRFYWMVRPHAQS